MAKQKKIEEPINMVDAIMNLREYGENDFPYNMFKLIMGDIAAKEFLQRINYYDAMAVGYTMINSLSTDHARFIMKMRFIDGMTLAKISEIDKRSVERIRQVIAKSCRLMRHSPENVFLTYGIRGGLKHEVDDRTENLNAVIKNLQDEILKLREALDNPNEKEKYKENPSLTELNIRLYNDGIEVLYLSSRSFNILARANLRKIGDVVKYFQDGDIDSLRGMGPASKAEIAEKLIEYGVDPANLEVDNRAFEAKAAEAKLRAELIKRQNLEREDRRKAIEKAEMAKAEAAIKELPAVRDAIINSAIDGIKAIFNGDVLHLLRKNIEQFLPNERIVSILMITEIIPADSNESPVRKLISQMGLDMYNQEAFERLKRYRSPVNHERYTLRAETLEETISSLDLDKPIAEFLEYLGVTSVEELMNMIQSGQLGALMNDSIDEYRDGYLIKNGYADVISMLARINCILDKSGYFRRRS